MSLFSRIRYRHKIAGVIFIFTLLPFLLVGIFVVKRSWDDKVNSILDESRSELIISVEAANAMLLSGLYKLSFINTNELIVSFLDKGEFSDIQNNLTVYENIKRIIDALKIDSQNISFTVYPFDNAVYNGNYIEKIERLETRLGKVRPDFFTRLMQARWDENVWLYYNISDQINESGQGYLCCYKKMQSLNKPLAIDEFRIKTDRFMDCITDKFPPGSYITFKPDVEEDYSIIKDISNVSGKHLSSTDFDIHKLDVSDYYRIEIRLNNDYSAYVAYIPRPYVASTLRSFLIFVAIFTLLSIFTLFAIVEIVTYFLTKRLTMLIDRVNTDMETVCGRSPVIRHSKDDDIGRMEVKFYDMVDRIQAYYQKNLDYENEKRSFELELLQSRINPHFLYNTLSSLRWNCNNKKMMNIIDAMVSYYRLALSKGDMIVKIRQEIKLIEEYLKIQKYTYESDFLYAFEVEENINDFLIVKNILQPVAENAVLHGIVGMESGGRIKLTGKLYDGMITLVVSDNGLGMPEEIVQQILHGEFVAKVGGYGIKNVRKRISLFYGADGNMNIISSPNNGTSVIFSFPAVYTEDQKMSKISKNQ